MQYSGMAYTCGSAYHYGRQEFSEPCPAAFAWAAQHRPLWDELVAAVSDAKLFFEAAANDVSIITEGHTFSATALFAKLRAILAKVERTTP